MIDYINRYRKKYPEDNLIPDEELIKLADYAFFSFRTAIQDCAAEIVKAIQPEIDRIKQFKIK